jgi:FKBP-type peptidyl-prolyl cis-trans isomerase SlyD
MQIEKNAVVTLTYVLKLDSGEIVDTASLESPFAFIHGIGQTLPAFDQNLQGLTESAVFAFSLTAEDGYGTYDASKMITVPKSAFDGAPPELEIAKGKTLPMQDNHGNLLWATITEVMPDGAVQMDLNHPLAGQNLHFSGTVVNVRAATLEELDHGHVHGPGGHHH